MNKFIICALSPLALVVAPGNALAESILASAASALTVAEPLANTSKEPVAFSYPIATNSVLEEVPAHRASSREFRLEVSAAQLTRGVALTTDAQGAVIRLSPLAGTASTLQVNDLELHAADGRRLAAADALDQLVDSADLRAAGMDAPDGALGFRLAGQLGAGRIVLRSVARHAAADRYLIAVLDRNSKTSLDLQASSASYLHGSRLVAQARLADDAGVREMSQVSASLHAPDGRSFVADVHPASDGGVQISAALRGAAPTVAGLWELRVAGETAQGIRRDVKTAFAVAKPTARLGRSVRGTVSADSLLVDVSAQVMHAGRYEARAVLYGTDGQGKRVPAMVGAMATWLEAGRGALTLEFTTAQLAAAGVTAPFELRDLRLFDQSRLALLEHRRNTILLD